MTAGQEFHLDQPVSVSLSYLTIIKLSLLLLRGYKGKVCTIDAGKISEEELGKNFPNTPMLAAIVKISGIVEPNAFVEDMEASFKHKFAGKPEVIAGNMKALTMAFEEVK